MKNKVELNILLVNTVPTERNGITGVIFSYLTAMGCGGLRMDMLSLNEPDISYRKKVEERGGRVYVLSRNGRHLWRYWNCLRNLIKHNEYDIVHIHGNSHTVVLELLAARLARCRVRIVHAHSTNCNSLIVHRVLTPLFTHLCTHKIACGEAAGRFMFGKKPFVVLNNGVDVKRFAFNETCRAAIRAQMGWEDKIILGHVGYFQEVKNQRFIVDVLSTLLKDSDDYRLVLIGDGEQRQAVERHVIELGLQEMVAFTGNIDNVSESLSAIDLVVMPSLFEGLPLTLIEQQANGLQCVVSDSITREVDKTGNVIFLPLSEGAGVWAEKIRQVDCMFGRVVRCERAADCITKNGYSITEEAMKLKEYYFKIVNIMN